MDWGGSAAQWNAMRWNSLRGYPLHRPAWSLVGDGLKCLHNLKLIGDRSMRKKLEKKAIIGS